MPMHDLRATLALFQHRGSQSAAFDMTRFSLVRKLPSAAFEKVSPLAVMNDRPFGDPRP